MFQTLTRIFTHLIALIHNLNNQTVSGSKGFVADLVCTALDSTGMII